MSSVSIANGLEHLPASAGLCRSCPAASFLLWRLWSLTGHREDAGLCFRCRPQKCPQHHLLTEMSEHQVAGNRLLFVLRRCGRSLMELKLWRRLPPLVSVVHFRLASFIHVHPRPTQRCSQLRGCLRPRQRRPAIAYHLQIARHQPRVQSPVVGLTDTRRTDLRHGTQLRRLSYHTTGDTPRSSWKYRDTSNVSAGLSILINKSDGNPKT